MILTRIRQTRLNLGLIIIRVLLICFGVVIIIPFYWMVVAGTLDVREILRYPPRLVPGEFFLRNVRELQDALPFARAFANSLFIGVSIMLLQLFFCSLGGFAFAKYEFPAKELLFVTVLGTMMIPSAVGIIPWYIMMSRFGWVDTYQALIIPGAVGAFGIFWMRQNIESTVPNEMLDAGRIDGCSHFGLYGRIVVPVIVPGLGALGLMTFMGSWNDYLSPLIILQDLQKFTLPIILALLNNQYGTRLHLVMTGATLATLPILFVFFLASDRFIKGLTAGSVKA